MHDREPRLIGRVAKNYDRNRFSMIPFALGSVLACAVVGGVALYASSRERADECDLIKAMVLNEAEEALVRGQFPSRDQQDRWAQLSRKCQP